MIEWAHNNFVIVISLLIIIVYGNILLNGYGIDDGLVIERHPTRIYFFFRK